MSQVGVSVDVSQGLVPLVAIAALTAIASAAGAIHDDGLVPSLETGDAGDELGDAVVVWNDTALVGAPGTSVDGADDQGVVYVYTQGDAGWTQAARLTASDGAEGDRFGAAVDVREDVAIVGARSASVEGESRQGAAYLFEAPEGDWSAAAETRLVASDGDGGGRFGTAVAIAEDTAIVGATGARVDGTLGQGAAYIYDAAHGGWSDAVETRISAEDGDRFDRFGSSVALQEGTAVVGVAQANVDGNDDQGAAYVFTPDEVGWGSTAQTQVTVDGEEDDRFGSSVAIDGDTLVVGAQRAGEAHVFTHDGRTWSPAATLTAGTGASNDYFGASVAIDGDSLLVGAPQADVDGNSDQGQARLFVAEEGAWTDANATHVTGASSDLFDRFGSSADLHRETVLVGAPNANRGGEDAEGEAYAGSLHLDGGGLAVAIGEVRFAGDTLDVGETALFNVTATAGGHPLATVEVTVGGDVLASENVTGGDRVTLAVEWIPETAGRHTIQARATDESGQTIGANLAIGVENATEGPEASGSQQTFQISNLEGDQVEIPLNGLGAETGVALDRMRLALSDDRPVEASMTMQVSEDTDEAQAPCQSDPTAAFVQVDHPGLSDDDIEEATLDFSLDASELEDAGLEPDEVSLHRYAGQPIATAFVGNDPVLENAELVFPEEASPPDVSQGWTVILVPDEEGSDEVSGSGDGCGSLEVSDGQDDNATAALPGQDGWVAIFRPGHHAWEADAFREDPATPGGLTTFGPGTVGALEPIHVGLETGFLALDPYELQPGHEIHFTQSTTITAFVVDEGVSLRPADSLSSQDAEAAGTVGSLPAQSAWESVPTEHLGGGQLDGTESFQAKSPGLSLFVVAPKVPRITVSALDPIEPDLAEGDEFTLDATLENRGERAGSKTLALRIGEAVVDEDSVTLEAGERTNVTLSWTVDDREGTLPVTVSGHDAGTLRLGPAAQDPVGDGTDDPDAPGEEPGSATDAVPFPFVEAIAAIAIATIAHAFGGRRA